MTEKYNKNSMYIQKTEFLIVKFRSENLIKIIAISMFKTANNWMKFHHNTNYII